MSDKIKIAVLIPHNDILEGSVMRVDSETDDTYNCTHTSKHGTYSGIEADKDKCAVFKEFDNFLERLKWSAEQKKILEDRLANK